MKDEIYWNKSLILTKIAIKNQSLIPLNTYLDTEISKVNDYEVRRLSRTIKSKNNFIGPRVNPFIPWEPDLEIDVINNSHALILNKYPVQVGHMLLISNEWKPQNGWLSFDDFKAICDVNSDTSGLWFFNSSSKAGASQPHRHIQLLRRNKTEKICPRENWFSDKKNYYLNKHMKLFKNICVIRNDNGHDISDPNSLYSNYIKLSEIINIGNPYKNSKPKLPYNLLISNQWFVIIIRAKDESRGFSINALGFAGYFLATNYSDINWLKDNGANKLLEEVVCI